MKPVHNGSLLSAFIDYAKVLDSVYTAAVLEEFEYGVIQETDIRILEDIYKCCKGRAISITRRMERSCSKRESSKGALYLQNFSSLSEGKIKESLLI